jgi:hypothetical protein
MDDEGIDIDTEMLIRILDAQGSYAETLGLAGSPRMKDLQREVTRDLNRMMAYANTRSARMPNPIFVLVDKQTLNMLRKFYEENNDAQSL